MAELRIDTALGSLVAVAKYYGIPAEHEQIKRAYVVRPEGWIRLPSCGPLETSG